MTLPYFESIKSVKYKFIQESLTHISLISYSMYLFHWLLVRTADMKIFADVCGFVKFIFVWIGTIVVASYQYKYFEKPITALRDKF